MRIIIKEHGREAHAAGGVAAL